MEEDSGRRSPRVHKRRNCGFLIYFFHTEFQKISGVLGDPLLFSKASIDEDFLDLGLWREVFTYH